MDDRSRFCGQNSAGPRYAQRDAGSRTAGARYGRSPRRVPYGRARQRRFPESKGTPRFPARLPDDRALDVLAHRADGCGTRQTARPTGADTDTVARAALRVGPHARQLPDEWAAFSPSNGRGPGG